ncbi:MAG: hypothetical protein HYY59_03645 [Candidatus Omnitrophica bacterium]|nr:hypothetical protein [Candidatus Omnitrophota bacterium]MBI3021077.1 hypothetical protein [Candidatus Omnitrophota bacterium]
MSRAHPVPTFLKPCLWSYDIRKLDLIANAETILTQVLNYGNWRAVRWALATYEPATIRQVVAHPRRGQWFPQVLNLWTRMYRIRLPSWLVTVAIRDVHPNPARWKATERYRRRWAQRKHDLHQPKIRRR